MEMDPRIERFMISTYKDKKKDFSASMFTRSNYQLWTLKHTDPATIDNSKVNFKSLLGSAVHAFFEQVDILFGIQELQMHRSIGDVSIGGSADLIEWDPKQNKWTMNDYKTKGSSTHKKFFDGERYNEVLQLSIYRWMLEGKMEISDTAHIYLFLIGHTSASKRPEKAIFDIELLPLDHTEAIIKEKIEAALGDEPPVFDCNVHTMCRFCNVAHNCQYIKSQYENKCPPFEPEID